MKLYFKYYLVFLLLTSLLSNYTYSQSIISLDKNTEIENIGRQTFFLEDASLKYTIDDVVANQLQKQFRPYSQETINFSSTASAYWLKFTIKKEDRGNFYLNIGSAYIDAISLYELDEKGELISTRTTGDDYPFNSREIEVGNYLFALNLTENTTQTFYLRVKSDQPLFFLLRVGTLANFVAYEHDLDFLQGLYFGFMLLIFLYNLFLFFSTKERIYLYYISYVFSITWFMASVFGYFFEYFWPENPYLNQLVVVSSGLTMITATLFTQKFLNTKKSNSRLHKGSYVFLIAGFLVCALVIFGYRIEGLKLAQGGLLIMAIYFIILGVRFRLKGYRPAKYYLLAWGSLVIGITFAILESLNQIPVMPYINAMQIGSALEVMLLSFALGDRIKMYKKQKEDAQLEALNAARENERLIQEQNVILEKKVKERTAEVASQNKKLVDLNKEKDMLVNMVAHDLRTPLHQMKGLIWLLDIPSLKLHEEKEEYLNEIDNSVDRLAQMISRVLDTHALEKNEVKLSREIINMVDLAEKVSQQFQLSAKQKNIELSVKASSKEQFIDIDKNYMIQILENLLSNALKFSEKGSKVNLEVKSNIENTFIIVEDNGPGISEEDQKKLFGRFQRLSAQPTAGESSIGLGLSIVKKYVEAMDGTIHCESELGTGTKFIITFKTKSRVTKAAPN